MNTVYVYALVEEHKRNLPAFDRALQAVPVGNIFAVVKRVSAAPPVTEGTLRAQHAIVSALARRVDAILPARFGALIDLAELEAVVCARSHTLHEAFDLVRGREQMTVRVFGPLSKTGRAAADQADGREYLRRRARPSGERTVADRVRDSVAPLVAGERLESGRRNHLAFHHLVSRGAARRYRSAVDRTARRVPSSIAIRVSGPWPPFAFAPSLWT